MTQNSILKLSNVSKKIGNHQILSHINLEIGQGEIVGLLGPNGSGKTTLIRTIVGLARANEGTITIDGKSLYRDFDEAISQVGAIVENPEFYAHMTGLQNLKQYAAMYAGVSDERIEEVIEHVRLKHAIHDKVSTYSLGMRQRLGIAQAILHHPKLLILDEPTNGLDPMGIREFRTYVKGICEKEQVSIIIATHLLREIEDICDRVAIIRSGEILHIDTVRNKSEVIQQVKLDVADPERTMKVIEQFGMPVRLHEEGLVLDLTREEIPETIAMLVQQGIRIYSVRTMNPSLEESFFNIIGESCDE